MDKININEILDDNKNVIGDESAPENSPNNETKANKTTDYNANVAHQRYGQSFLGRFGFYFLESEAKDEGLVYELAKLEYEQHSEVIKHIVENFSKENLKKWIEQSKKGFDNLTDEEKAEDYAVAYKVIKVIKDYAKKGKKESINEDEFVDTSDSGIISNQTNIPSITNITLNEKVSEIVELSGKLGISQDEKLAVIINIIEGIGVSEFDPSTKNKIINLIKNVIESK